MAEASGDRGSMLLLEDRFDRQDPLFLEELCKLRASKALGAFAARWAADPRTWARAQLEAYLDRPLDCPGHELLVKRLFKQAERAADDELMAAFLAAFDRHVRRVRRTRWQYDLAARQSWTKEYLAAPRKIERRPRLFHHRTRYYLRRRAWRYFRHLGFRRPAEYPEAVARALLRYRDEDLAKGENILDCWGLMNACFHGHAALRFGSTHVRLREGRALAELSAAPRFPDQWRKPESAAVLLGLLFEARARLVRVFALELLRREHTGRSALARPETVLRLLEHADSEVQGFGAELLQGAAGLAELPLELWLRMLKTSNLTALETVCAVLAEHVPPERFSLEQCVELACAEPVPAARLGLRLLRSRSFAAPEDRAGLAGLCEARCPATGRELAAWALDVVGAPGAYDRDVVIGFFDSRMREVREGAWSWLVPGSAGYADAALWSRLLETPFDELRLRLVDALETRSALPGAGPKDLGPLWCSVLLGVRRGGRQKQKAIRQIGRALQEEPSLAGQLVPVLGAAIRSVRAPESRAGLAALLEAVAARPELADAAGRFLPELDLAPPEAVVCT